jgi:hypothetical protein
MIIYEMFKETSSEKVIKELIKQPGFFWEIDINNELNDIQKAKFKSKIKQLYNDEINNIKNDKYKIIYNNDCIVVCSKRIEGNSDDEVYYDVSKLYKKDFCTIEKFEVNKPEEFKNPTVELLFEEREKVLGFQCSDYCIKKYGAEVILAALLREMCFFGINNNDCLKRKKEAENELIEAIKASENCNPEDYISEEDFWKELGLKDERTQEEKEEMKKRIHNQCIINIKEMITVYKEAAKEELKKEA